ncbi:MAG TPA: archaemetzincin family Zn-dependent metalloprotease [Ignavibacteriaceae bacterium]|nr:archaemetzincin family Zn-dependent metalloprotease [Ignavibacteriaceae bacterium]
MNIYIIPLELKNRTLLDSVFNELMTKFSAEIFIDYMQIPYENAHTDNRRQYYSTQIISNAINKLQHLNGKILLLTSLDLYVPALTYIFGEAQLGGKHSIVSACRLHEEFYSGLSNETLLIERTIKEALHELGHNFGLKHCDDWDCVMHSSPGIEEVDIKGKYYCRECSKAMPLKV